MWDDGKFLRRAKSQHFGFHPFATRSGVAMDHAQERASAWRRVEVASALDASDSSSLGMRRLRFFVSRANSPVGYARRPSNTPCTHQNHATKNAPSGDSTGDSRCSDMPPMPSASGGLVNLWRSELHKKDVRYPRFGIGITQSLDHCSPSTLQTF
jgi:hypothetical protein